MSKTINSKSIIYFILSSIVFIMLWNLRLEWWFTWFIFFPVSYSMFFYYIYKRSYKKVGDSLFKMEDVQKTDYPKIEINFEAIIEKNKELNEEIANKYERTAEVFFDDIDTPVIFTTGYAEPRIKYRTDEEIELKKKEYCGSSQNIEPYGENKKYIDTFIDPKFKKDFSKAKRRTQINMFTLYWVLVLIAFVILVFYFYSLFLLTVIAPTFMIILFIYIYEISNENQNRMICEEDVSSKLRKYRDDAEKRKKVMKNEW